RAVPSLDQAAFEEAHQRDDTAIRAFSSTQIKTPDGQCLTVDRLSGDFRANLTPVLATPCGANGTASQNQLWDVITRGKHNNVPKTILVVSTLTQACLNFDPRRAAGETVNLFSCGGRADGGGAVTDSQLFDFPAAASWGAGGGWPMPLMPMNGPADGAACLFVRTAGEGQAGVLDQMKCVPGEQSQMFSFVGSQTQGQEQGQSGNGTAAAPSPSESGNAVVPPSVPAETGASDPTESAGASPQPTESGAVAPPTPEPQPAESSPTA
ncbi:hypothetical protein K402DRAFT_296414, partial [Aulographum hederae CBS 113979]